MLRCRPASKSQQQNAPRRDTLFDQPGHAARECLGFARAGTGHHQQRPVTVRGRFPLRDVELIQPERRH